MAAATTAASTTSGIKSAFGQASKATTDFFGAPTVQSWLYYGGLPILAFIVLSPGMLITLPPSKDCNDNASFWFSGQTSFWAAALQAFLFFGVLVAIFKGGKALKLARPF